MIDFSKEIKKKNDNDDEDPQSGIDYFRYMLYEEKEREGEGRRVEEKVDRSRIA